MTEPANFSLSRVYTCNQGTIGVLVSQPPGPWFFCYTLELPWRDNLPDISCVVPGQYLCSVRVSPRWGKQFYYLAGVPGRSGVAIHKGNLAGDTSLGYTSHVQGCVLLGEKVGVLQGQLAVLDSAGAYNRFWTHLDRQPFNLEITGV